MPYQFVPYTVLLLVAASITTALVLWGLRYREVPGNKAFLFSMALGTLWSVANALEISATTLGSKLFWANVQYIAYSLAPVAWLIMVLYHTGKGHLATRKRVLLMLIIPMITNVLLWLDAAYGLVRHDIYLNTSGAFPVIAKEYGPWFWVHCLQSYVLSFSSVYLLVQAVRRSALVYRIQSVLLLIGTSIIIVVNLLYVMGVGLIKHYDTTPIVFSIVGALIAWGIFEFRLFVLVPIARERVVEAMENMVIVLDAMDRVVDVNTASKAVFQGNGQQSLIGRPLAELSKEVAALVSHKEELEKKAFTRVIGGITRYYEATISPIRDFTGMFVGQVIVITDITELKDIQDKLHKEQRELAVAAERELMVKDLHDNLGQVFSFASVQIKAAQLERKRGHEELADSYIERLGDIIEGAHQEVRNYVHAAHVNEYKNASIRSLLRSQLQRLADSGGTVSLDAIALEVDDHLEFPVEVKMQLVSMVKEALNNTLKHAKATAVGVSLRRKVGEYELIVEDNGVGFAGIRSRENGAKGSGLFIMEERARLLEGRIEIASQPNEGTRIIITFPDSKR